MNILILGGTGSIGSALVNLLRNTSWNVAITSRKKKDCAGNITYIEGNAHDLHFLRDCLKKEKWDAIVDFMTYTTEEFSKKYELFLSSTSQYFFLSSSRVYADSHDPLTENSARLLDVCNDIEYLKTDEYALAKARQENLLMMSASKNWTIIRPYKTYNSYRMQLGMFKKEDWLYRVLMGKTLAFPKIVAQKRTTLTFAEDVAIGIKELIGNPEALGEAFHITTTESFTWEEIYSQYVVVLQNLFHKNIKVLYVDNTFFDVWNKYQIIYDCNYDRVFDNSKINRVTNGKIKYTNFSNGCSRCLTTFISNPVWRSVNWKLQLWMDHITGDKIRLWDVIGSREKLRYVKASLYNR